MSKAVIPLGTAVPQLGPARSRIKAGTWGGRVVDVGDTRRGPDNQLARIGYHGQSALGGQVVAANSDGIRTAYANRLLAPPELDLIYRRTPDVRAAFDQISRVVSTEPWRLEITGLEPTDPEYDDALLVCEQAKLFLSQPISNGWSWQETCQPVVTDLLKYDLGAIELARTVGGGLDELVPLNGGELFEVVDERGRLKSWEQRLFTAHAGSTPYSTTIPPENLLALQLFRTTEGPGGVPLLESLVQEVIGILRGSEAIASSLDINEIPPGLLVVTGLASDALERFQAGFTAKRMQDWRIRMLGGEARGNIDARWVRFDRDPRELQVQELMDQIRRTIFRVIGVQPVTMGVTADVNRATAQVQFDASTSYLITPILEMLASKVNGTVLPLLLPEEFDGLVEFRFGREEQLSEADRKARSERLSLLVREGVLSVNEARAELGYDPREGQDDLRDVSPAPAPPTRPPAGEAPEDNDDDEDREGDDESVDDMPDSPSDEERRRPRSPVRYDLAARRRHAAREARRLARPYFGRNRLSLTSKALQARRLPALPSEWQPGSKFDQVRTLDLPRLGEQIEGYGSDVAELWAKARSVSISALAASYDPETFGPTERSAVYSQIVRALDQLAVEWALTTAPRYDAVALDARAAVGEWTAALDDEATIRLQADAYRQQAMGYLVAEDGPIEAVKRGVLELLQQIANQRARVASFDHRAVRLPTGAEASVVLSRLGDIFDGQLYRVHNWSGRLVELANQIAVGQLAPDAKLLESDSRGRRRRLHHRARPETEWWVEWVAVGDRRTCPTCEREGAEPVRPLATLPTTPGGSTECRARCRCVLVYWTREEVARGEVELFGPGGLPDVLPAPSTPAPAPVEPPLPAAPTRPRPFAEPHLIDATVADPFATPWMANSADQVLESLDFTRLLATQPIEQLVDLTESEIAELARVLARRVLDGELTSAATLHYLDGFRLASAADPIAASDILQAQLERGLYAIRARLRQRDLASLARLQGGDWSYGPRGAQGAQWEIESWLQYQTETLAFHDDLEELVSQIVRALEVGDEAFLASVHTDALAADYALELGLQARALAADEQGRLTLAETLRDWQRARRARDRGVRVGALPEFFAELDTYRAAESYAHVLLNDGVDRNTSIILEASRRPIDRAAINTVDVRRPAPPPDSLGPLFPEPAPRTQPGWDWGYIATDPDRSEMVTSVAWQLDGRLRLPSTGMADSVLYPDIELLDHSVRQGARLRAHTLSSTGQWEMDTIRRRMAEAGVIGGDVDEIAMLLQDFDLAYLQRGLQVAPEVADALVLGSVIDLSGVNAFSFDGGFGELFAGFTTGPRSGLGVLLKIRNAPGLRQRLAMNWAFHLGDDVASIEAALSDLPGEVLVHGKRARVVSVRPRLNDAGTLLGYEVEIEIVDEATGAVQLHAGGIGWPIER